MSSQNEKVNLFATPLWTYYLDNSEDLNKKLYKESQYYQDGMNLFDFPGSGIAQLKQQLVACAESVAKEYQWRSNNGKPSYYHARQNPIGPNEFDTPHYHENSKLIAVYYVIANDKSGDIILHDTRGATNWIDPAVVTESTGRECRTYHRITPRPGMMIMFPSYLIHSVEPNFSGTMRLSIAMSVQE